DMAAACVFLMSLPDAKFDRLLGSDESISGRFEPPLVNIGTGVDLTIAELALLIKDVTGFQGEIVFDPSKPDGTPRKLLDVSLLAAAGWTATTSLADGLRIAYRDYLADQSALHTADPAP
ncbi:MAG TPA: GDP-L-fucose synthase, partial [Burkholderiaceae bacterium]|nr:GDP-L-fucose synthase [Burkholderiaceae bacterium]